MNTTEALTLVVIIIPLLLHALGLALLTVSKFSDRNYGLTQKIYLVNLTVAEMMTCVLGIAKRMYRAEVHFRWLSLIQFIFVYMMYEALVFMSLDRCMAVYLNIRFPLYWNNRSTLKLIVFTWLLNASLSLTFWYSDITIRTVEAIMFPVFDFVFLSVSIPTYLYIYVKIKEKQRKDNRTRPSVIYTNRAGSITEAAIPTNRGQQEEPRNYKETTNRVKPLKLDNQNTVVTMDNRKKQKTVKFEEQGKQKTAGIFKTTGKLRQKRNTITKNSNKQFLSIFLLVITFVVFTIVPDIVYLYYFVRDVTMESGTRLVSIMYFMSLMCDFLIYTFTVEPVRRTLKKLFNCNTT